MGRHRQGLEGIGCFSMPVARFVKGDRRPGCSGSGRAGLDRHARRRAATGTDEDAVFTGQCPTRREHYYAAIDISASREGHPTRMVTTLAEEAMATAAGRGFLAATSTLREITKPVNGSTARDRRSPPPPPHPPSKRSAAVQTRRAGRIGTNARRWVATTHLGSSRADLSRPVPNARRDLTIGLPPWNLRLRHGDTA